MRRQPQPPKRSHQVILADTPIWIDHFRYVDAELRRVIEDDRLLCHLNIIIISAVERVGALIRKS